MKLSYFLPEELIPFQEKLAATKQVYTKVIPMVEEEPAYLWSSKIGGIPYLPKTTPFPKSEDGRHLFFLAQINLVEAQVGLPFPNKGILQFYISDDGAYGCDFENGYNQDKFRVLFFDEIIEDESELVTDFSFLPTYGDLPIYADKTVALTFDKAVEIAPVSDVHFSKKVDVDFFKQFGDAQWDVHNAYAEEVNAGGHKLGGYAHFAQDDPRKMDNPLFLLFQLDTDIELETMWGDMGSAHFFINREDLENRDFSNVLYHWDCY